MTTLDRWLRSKAIIFTINQVVHTHKCVCLVQVSAITDAVQDFTLQKQPHEYRLILDIQGIHLSREGS